MYIDQQTAYRQSAEASRDNVRFWRERRLDDLECLKAHYRRHRYLPHIHDTYALGIITDGAEAFSYRGTTHVARPGQVVCVNPGEIHDGRPVRDGFSYRMLYPSIDLVAGVASDLHDRPMPAPMVDEAVIDDPDLAGRLAKLHILTEAGEGRLALETALTEAISLLIARHGALDRSVRRPGRESGPVARVRVAIEAHPERDVGLDDLASIAGLSRYHLLRAFRREVGVTPHAFVTGRRVARAKRLLADAEPLSGVALACGFYDQSHFTRTFKAWTGITPGQYRAGSALPQDAPS
jgi:AraC-like DNA-binding protein